MNLEPQPENTFYQFMKPFSIIIILLIFGFSQLSAQTEELKSLPFFNNTITLEVPADFTPMDSELRKYKYPGKSEKTAHIYANEAGDLNLVVELTEAKCSGTGEETDAIEASLLKQLEAAPNVKVVDHQTGSFNNINLVGVTSNVTTPHGEELTTLLLGFCLNGRTCFIAFTGPTASQSDWMSIQQRVAQSCLSSINP